MSGRLRPRLSRTFSPARWREYADLLTAAREHGYELLPLEQWAEERSERDGGLILLRHDVDQHPGSALRMARIEHRLGVRSTWYFRWRTADPGVIAEIRRLGGSVGLHYETLTRLTLKGEVPHGGDPAALARAREILRDEVASFQALYGPIGSIAAHGDTRTPTVRNSDLVRDFPVAELGVSFDGSEVLKGRGLGAWLTDRSGAEGGWTEGLDPYELLREGRTPILLLTHPNNWVSGPVLWLDRLGRALLPSPRRDRSSHLVRTGSDEPPSR